MWIYGVHIWCSNLQKRGEEVDLGVWRWKKTVIGFSLLLYDSQTAVLQAQSQCLNTQKRERIRYTKPYVETVPHVPLEMKSTRLSYCTFRRWVGMSAWTRVLGKNFKDRLGNQNHMYIWVQPTKSNTYILKINFDV